MNRHIRTRRSLQEDTATADHPTFIPDDNTYVHDDDTYRLVSGGTSSTSRPLRRDIIILSVLISLIVVLSLVLVVLLLPMIRQYYVRIRRSRRRRLRKTTNKRQRRANTIDNWLVRKTVREHGEGCGCQLRHGDDKTSEHNNNEGTESETEIESGTESSDDDVVIMEAGNKDIVRQDDLQTIPERSIVMQELSEDKSIGKRHNEYIKRGHDDNGGDESVASDGNEIEEDLPSAGSPLKRTSSRVSLAIDDDGDDTSDESDAEAEAKAEEDALIIARSSTILSEGESSNCCSICMEVFKVGDQVSFAVDPNCGHVFHHKCIREWLMRHTDCPYCRCTCLPVDRGTENSNSNSPTEQVEDADEEDPASFLDTVSILWYGNREVQRQEQQRRQRKKQKLENRSSPEYIKMLARERSHRSRTTYYCIEHGLMVLPTSPKSSK